jgi:hypothetical protein
MRLSTIHPAGAPEIINIETRIYGAMQLGKDPYLDAMLLEVKRLWENGDREARAHVERREYQVRSADGKRTEIRNVWYVSLDWLEEIHKSLFGGWSMPVPPRASLQ